MVSYHSAKFGGHGHCSIGDITFLVFEEQDSTCSLKFVITVYHMACHSHTHKISEAIYNYLLYHFNKKRY